MELKDILYTVGIFATIIVSSLNYIITLKNRRNFLREYFYKEQFTLLGRLNAEFHNLNMLLIKSLKSKIDEDLINQKIEEIQNVFYSNSHLISTKVLTECKEAILIVESLLEVIKSQDSHLLDYDSYYRFNEKYHEILKLIVSDLGVSQLFLENKSLVK